jgi:hypothetical protein
VQGEIKAAQLAIPRINSSLSESKQKLTAAESAFRSRSQAEDNEVKLALQISLFCTPNKKRW